MYAACAAVLLISNVIAVVLSSYLLIFWCYCSLGYSRTALVHSTDFLYCTPILHIRAHILLAVTQALLFKHSNGDEEKQDRIYSRMSKYNKI